jgi:hypothetical protein
MINFPPSDEPDQSKGMKPTVSVILSMNISFLDGFCRKNRRGAAKVKP